jgi:DNA polymerase-1
MQNLKENHNADVLALCDRVKKGNDKLFQAWLQIRELADKEEWSYQMDRWQEATEKLHQLCQELKLKGYTDCLYFENGKKMRRCLDNPDGFWCQVCPSIYPYWETERMGQPGSKVPKPELVAEVVALHTRKLLDSRGWCLWKCSRFDGEEIVVVRDETVVGYPRGHRVYSEAELEKLVQGNIMDSRDGDFTVSDASGAVNATAIAVPPPGGLITDPAEARALAEHLARESPVALDLETTGLDPHQAKVRLVSLATSEGTWVVDAFHVPLDGLRPVLEGAPRKICHNAKCEARFLMASGIQRPGPFFDTLLADQVLGGRSYGRSLAEVTNEYLDQKLDKSQQKSNWSQALTPEQLDYARRDAEVLLGLAAAQERELEANRLSAVAELEFRALPCIAWMEQQGAPFQLDDWNTIAQEAEGERSRLVQELNRAVRTVLPGDMFGDSSVNWDSVPQVVKLLNDLGLEVADTRQETLEAFREAHPVISLLLDYRQAAKRMGTYGKDWSKYINPATVRIHPDWKQIGAETGRMACREPNLQNLPRDPRYRACFTPAPGRVLAMADYSQIELRIVAELTGDKRLVAAFREGQDLHALTASLVLGKPVGDITPEERQMAKALNFGLIYGLGAKGLIAHARSNYRVELTEIQAQQFRNKFFQAYPSVRKWQYAHSRDTESRTLLGRRRVFTEDNPATWRFNTPVQGTGADIVKLALAYLWETPGPEDTFPVLVIHDEIVVETPAECVEEAETWLRGAMERAGAQTLNLVPVVVETNIENTKEGARQDSRQG